MDVMNAVVEFGTDAVLRYRTMSQKPDNEVQEYFLGSCIAQRLHDRFACCVQLEPLYADIASYLAVPSSPELTSKIGGWRADIAMYQNGFPPAIIELKIPDERHPLVDVEFDAFKLRRLGKICKIRGYVGVLICQTTDSLEEQTERLETALQGKFHTWTAQRSRDGQWQWCLGCSLVSDNPQPDGIGDVT
jgi:hypothetical protein